jgi:hypothetical protein
MKRKIKLKRLIQMIFDITLLLSLSGCTGCSLDEQNSVTVTNRSTKFVRVSIISQENPGGGGVMLGPESKTETEIGNTYTVRVVVEEKWVSFARSRREELEYISYQSNNIEGAKKLSAKEMKELQAKISEINKRIEEYDQSGHTVSCSGIVKTAVANDNTAANAYIYDSTDGIGVSVSCSGIE